MIFGANFLSVNHSPPHALITVLLIDDVISLFLFHVVDGYLKIAKDQYSYNIDQALGMLYYHGYDIEQSVADLPNFCPLQGERERERGRGKGEREGGREGENCSCLK